MPTFFIYAIFPFRQWAIHNILTFVAVTPGRLFNTFSRIFIDFLLLLLFFPSCYYIRKNVTLISTIFVLFWIVCFSFFIAYSPDVF